MTVLSVIPAKPWHCGQMARILRTEHASAVLRLGIAPHRELWERFNTSAFRRALLIDGELAGLGGVVGNLLSPDGYVWLALAQSAMKHRFSVIREAKRQLAEIMKTRRYLSTAIIDGDNKARNLAIFLGFMPCDMMGRTEGAVSRFGRRTMADEMGDEDNKARFPIGNGSAVAMTYAGRVN